MSGNTVITDGKTNNTAEVDSKHRLRTRAVTITAGTDASIDGLQYILSPPVINVSTDNETAILWAKNLDSDGLSWIVSSIDFIVGESQGGVGDWFVNFYINDDNGNIATSGNPTAAIPLNFGNTTPLGIDAKYGGDGFSFSTVSMITRLASGTPKDLQIPLDSVIVPVGTSVGVSIVPPVGSTSLNVDPSFTIIRGVE